MRTLPTLPTRSLLLLGTSLALVLSACAGADAELPTADEIGDVAGDVAGDDPATSAMCVEDEPDCVDVLVDPAEGEGLAGSSCLAGDEDCTDESYGGGDHTVVVGLGTASSGEPTIERGATSGASGKVIAAAYLVNDTTLELTFEGGACDLVEDVLVTETDAEVRILVLAAQDASVEVCTAEVVAWTTEVSLDAPLDGRILLDLAG